MQNKKIENFPSQHWDSKIYSENARFVTDYGEELLRLLNPKSNEKIMDLGCGDGVLTKKIQDFGCEVLGIDGSKAFVESAKKIGVDALVVDAQKMTFENEFDAVFSNAALHWMLDAQGVVSGVAKALKKGGRFVAETGTEGNVGKIREILYKTIEKYGYKGKICWYFPSKEEKTKLLEKNGFEVEKIITFRRPTPLPTGIKGWLETFSKPVLEDIPKELQSKIIDESSEILEKTLPKNENGETLADYVRLRFVAFKK